MIWVMTVYFYVEDGVQQKSSAMFHDMKLVSDVYPNLNVVKELSQYFGWAKETMEK